MKKFALTLIALVGVFALSSCGGGWTEENKASLKETCSGVMKISYDEADATSICSCYMDGLVKKYPNADFTPEQNMAEMDACSANYKTTFDKEQEAAAAAAAAAEMPADTTMTPAAE